MLDANVWVSYVVSQHKGDSRSIVVKLVDSVRAMAAGRMPLQIILSHELLDTIARVLRRLHFTPLFVAEFIESLIDLMMLGPDEMPPTLLLGGRDQLAMHDREDAGILASCIAAQVGLLVTDNLRDFEMNDTERLDTRDVHMKDKRVRRLYALIHDRSGTGLVIMHPVDVLAWFQAGERPTPDNVRQRYGGRPRFT